MVKTRINDAAIATSDWVNHTHALITELDGGLAARGAPRGPAPWAGLVARERGRGRAVRLRIRLLVLVGVVAGVLSWDLVRLLGNRSEAWDDPSYWWIGYPILLFTAFILAVGPSSVVQALASHWGCPLESAPGTFAVAAADAPVIGADATLEAAFAAFAGGAAAVAVRDGDGRIAGALTPRRVMEALARI